MSSARKRPNVNRRQHGIALPSYIPYSGTISDQQRGPGSFTSTIDTSGNTAGGSVASTLDLTNAADQTATQSVTTFSGASTTYITNATGFAGNSDTTTTNLTA